jgi:hypothetical protein
VVRGTDPIHRVLKLTGVEEMLVLVDHHSYDLVPPPVQLSMQTLLRGFGSCSGGAFPSGLAARWLLCLPLDPVGTDKRTPWTIYENRPVIMGGQRACAPWWTPAPAPSSKTERVVLRERAARSWKVLGVVRWAASSLVKRSSPLRLPAWMRSSRVQATTCPLRTTCDRVVRPGADDRNRGRKRTRLGGRAGSS